MAEAVSLNLILVRRVCISVDQDQHDELSLNTENGVIFSFNGHSSCYSPNMSLIVLGVSIASLNSTVLISALP